MWTPSINAVRAIRQLNHQSTSFLAADLSPWPTSTRRCNAAIFPLSGEQRAYSGHDWDGRPNCDIGSVAVSQRTHSLGASKSVSARLERAIPRTEIPERGPC
jgi:hypothetical protein